MYARQVSMELRSNSRADFARTIESEVLPLLRKQKGFRDEIAFVDPAGKDAVAVSLWDSKESAEAYHHTTFAEVTKLLTKLVEGKPTVKSYEVANSTMHRIAASQKAA
jgi:heme-degrading monooxygenase HmoA